MNHPRTRPQNRNEWTHLYDVSEADRQEAQRVVEVAHHPADRNLEQAVADPRVGCQIGLLLHHLPVEDLQRVAPRVALGER